MNYDVTTSLNKRFSVKKILFIALAIPVAAAIFYVLLYSVINIGEYLEQYIGVAGYLAAIAIVALLAHLFCRLVVKPIRRAVFPD
jgi:predicted neutral ceramidase superfamily lipid hydrolase